MTTQPTARVLTTPDYLRVLAEEKLLTFETVVDGHVSHHQISVLQYDTREKIEARMAEILVQVMGELERNKMRERKAPLAPEINALIEAHTIKPTLH